MCLLIMENIKSNAVGWWGLIVEGKQTDLLSLVKMLCANKSLFALRQRTLDRI